MSTKETYNLTSRYSGQSTFEILVSLELNPRPEGSDHVFVAEAINSLVHTEHTRLFELNINQSFNNNIIASIAESLLSSHHQKPCGNVVI